MKQEKRKITGRKRAVYDYLVSYITENGYPPTYREIMMAVNLKSKSNIHLILLQLHNAGLIDFNDEGRQRRTIRLIGYKMVRDESVILPI